MRCRGGSITCQCRTGQGHHPIVRRRWSYLRQLRFVNSRHNRRTEHWQFCHYDCRIIPPLSPRERISRGGGQLGIGGNARICLPGHQCWRASILETYGRGTDVALISRTNSKGISIQDGSLVVLRWISFAGTHIRKYRGWTIAECEMHCCGGIGGRAECVLFGTGRGSVG